MTQKELLIIARVVIRGPGNPTPQEATIPGQVTGLVASAGRNNVALSWNAPPNGGAPILDYLVEYRNNSSADWIEFGNVAQRSVDISPLSLGVTYVFRVTARNSEGLGVTSSEITATPATTPEASSLIEANPGDSEVVLRWTSAFGNGLPILYYRVQYKRATSSTWLNWGDIENIQTTVTGLDNNVVYEFRVFAGNALGVGQVSNVLSATPQAVPATVGGLTAVPQDGGLIVSWPAVPGASSYVLQHSLAGQNVWTQEGAVTDPTDTITGLENGSEYDVRVFASNGVGTSLPGEPATFIPGTVPEAIDSLQATPFSGSVVLDWDMPDEKGYPITEYIVYVKEDTAGSYTEYSRVQSLAEQVEGLTDGTLYNFYVVARNDRGLSGDSNTVNSTPASAASVPATISSISGEAGDGSVLLAWPVPLDNGSAITSYTLRYRIAGSSDAYTLVSGIVVNFREVTGLTNGQSYEFSVRAENGEGSGAYSSLLTLSPVAAVASAYVVIGDSSSPSSTAETLKTRIEGLGHTVTYISDESATQAGAEANSFFIVLQSTGTGTLGTTLRDAAVPGMILDRALLPNFELTSSTFTVGGSVVDVVSPANPLAAGFPAGNLTIFDSGTGKGYATGGIPPTATIITEASSLPNIYEVEAGEESINSEFDFPAYRLAWLASNNEVVGNANWFTLFDAAIARLVEKAGIGGGSAATVPTGLAATPGDREAQVSWAAVSGAVYYQLEWEDQTAASGTNTLYVVANNANITGLVNGNTHRVRVRAVNASGESAYTSYSSFTPAVPGAGSLPADATFLSLGSSSNSITNNSGTYTLSDTGGNISSSADNLGFLYFQADGDFDAVMRVSAFTGSSQFDYVGLMAREGLAGGNRMLSLLLTPAGGAETRFRYRQTENGNAGTDQFTQQEPAIWLRIRRIGNVFEGYTGQDGVNWVLSGSRTLALSANTSVGMVIASSGGANATADNFSVAASSFTETPQQVGTPSVTNLDSALRVNWSEPGGFPTSYTLEYRPTGGSFTTVPAISETTYLIQSLANDQEYEIQVRAENSNGSGTYSDLATGTPRATADISFPYYGSLPALEEEDLAGYAWEELRKLWGRDSSRPNVRFVTNTNPDGDGSLKQALESSTKDIIIPLVGGFVQVNDDVAMDASKLFWGATAPGSGLSLIGHQLITKTGSSGIYLLSHLGLRCGLNALPSQADCLNIRDAEYVGLDHVTMTQAVDATLDTQANRLQMDTRRCLFMQALGLDENGDIIHPDPETSQGHNFFGTFQAREPSQGFVNVTMFEDVISDMRQRSPKLEGRGNIVAIKQLVQNWGERAGDIEDPLHVSFVGCIWRTGQDGKTTNPGAFSQAPVQVKDPFNSGAGRSIWLQDCEHYRDGQLVNYADQFGHLRSVNAARRASSWDHHSAPHYFDQLGLSFTGGQATVNELCTKTGMFPLNRIPEDAENVERIRNNTSRWQVGGVNYSSASSQQVSRTQASLGLPPENEYWDLNQKGRFKLEQRLLDIKNEVEGLV